jgi:hypothetical protein
LWKSVQSVSGIMLPSIDCPSLLVCEVVGAPPQRLVAYRVTQGGSVWTTQTVPRLTGSLPAVSCGAPTRCELVSTHSDDARGIKYGVALGLGAGSSTWVRQRLPVGVGSGLADVSCPTALWCEAVGVAPDRLLALGTDDARTWVVQNLP